jgi:hypothetical protein
MRRNLDQKSLGPLKISLEMAHKVNCPKNQKRYQKNAEFDADFKSVEKVF